MALWKRAQFMSDNPNARIIFCVNPECLLCKNSFGKIKKNGQHDLRCKVLERVDCFEEADEIVLEKIINETKNEKGETVIKTEKTSFTDIKKKFVKILEKDFMVDYNEAMNNLRTNLEHFELDSLDLVELRTICEEKFNIRIEENEEKDTAIGWIYMIYDKKKGGE